MASLADVLNQAAVGPKQQAELAMMIKTQTDAWLEEGMKKGWEEGLERGREEGCHIGARATLLRVARRRLGDPTAEERLRLDGIRDLDRLARVADAIAGAASWDDLLAIQ